MKRTLEQVRAILSTPRVEKRWNCDCLDCQRAKLTPFRCTTCGYVGRPATLPCDCATEVASWTSYSDVALAQPEWPADWKTTREELAADLAVLRACGEIRQCRGEGKDQPPPVRRLVTGTCMHTVPSCPVCLECDFDHGEGQSNVIAIVRELNALLA